MAGSPKPALITALLPCLLAAVFGCWSLRGVASTTVVDTDAARHAMNGAFLHDLLGSGHWHDPVRYGEWYYSRLPALSIPYHPPLFPAFEALAYSIGGVNLFAARAAVALCVVLSALLLYGLVVRTHGSATIAFSATLLFLAAPVSQRVAGDVMLEFPAMVWALLAVRQLAFMEQSGKRWGAARYALFAVAAIWTKQAVFLCLLPLVYAAVTREWHWFRRPRFWMCLGLTAGGTIALAALSWQLGWSGINQSWAHRDALTQALFNIRFYLRHLLTPWTAAAVLAVGGLLVYTRARWPERDALYWAWLISAGLMLLASPAYTTRYLFFAYPPALALGCGWADALLGRFRLRPAVPAIAAACAVFAMQTPPAYLRGPDEAARWLHDRGLHRVIYCGLTDGNFIFSMRALGSRPDTLVIRGEKLPRETAQPGSLMAFARRHAIDAIVLERTSEPQVWDRLGDVSGAQRIAMASSERRLRGELRIIAVSHGAEAAGESVAIPVNILGRNIEAHF